jgi:tripartite-type tricarboxylate transporter receptor subunit TctC
VPRQSGAPTLKELGHDMVVTSPLGVSGTRGRDSGVVSVLHDAIKATLFRPANTAVRGRFDMPERYWTAKGTPT